MKSILSLFAAISLVASTGAIASGFNCSENGGDYAVKLRNHVQPSRGTTNPAILVVSDANGTLLVRKGESIRKHLRVNTTQYVVEGSRKLDADTAILQISFLEGSGSLEGGEVVDGQLILVKDGERSVHELSCTRYLKD